MAFAQDADAGPASGAAPVTPLPIEAYGAEARIDMIALSPSGDRLARVQVVDGQRVLVVSRIGDGHRIYAGRIGEAKVRGLSWVGEDHVLIYSSQTRSVAGLGIPPQRIVLWQYPESGNGQAGPCAGTHT